MVRNAIETDFRTSKMAAGSHFVKNNHKNKNCGIDLKWQDVILGYPKWLPAAIFLKIFTTKFVGNEAIYSVRPLGRMHTILVLFRFREIIYRLCEIISRFREIVSLFREIISPFCKIVSPFREIIYRFCEIVSRFREIISRFREII